MDRVIDERTYTMLTDLEAVFRSLKTDLGLRPIDHQVQRRVSGHLFITVLAYQLVQIIRRHLMERLLRQSGQRVPREGRFPQDR